MTPTNGVLQWGHQRAVIMSSERGAPLEHTGAAGVEDGAVA